MTIFDVLVFAVAILLALFALGVILFWMHTRARKQKSFKSGMAYLEKRQYSQALYYFGKAEIVVGPAMTT